MPHAARRLHAWLIFDVRQGSVNASNFTATKANDVSKEKGTPVDAFTILGVIGFVLGTFGFVFALSASASIARLEADLRARGIIGEKKKA